MTAPAPDGDTLDLLLGGRVQLRQPRRGYRVSIDTFLVAAAVPARPGQRVLEVGMGTGGAALALARRCPDVAVTGLEGQTLLADYAADNIALNGLGDRVRVCVGQLEDDALADHPAFDHVFANPPYLETGQGAASPVAGKAAAHRHERLSLDDWVSFCLARCRPRGSLTFIHRADRLADLVALLCGPAGEVTVFPLWPKPGRPAKRVIVQARKAVRGGSRLLPGLILHGEDIRYTPQAEAVLRDGAALDLSATPSH